MGIISTYSMYLDKSNYQKISSLNDITNLPSIVSGIFKKSWGSATNLMPSTTRVTLSGNVTGTPYLFTMEVVDILGATLEAGVNAGANAEEELRANDLLL